MSRAAPLQLGRFSLGVGDRFAHQGKAQLAACIQAAQAGTAVTPVWNKSNREHDLVGSEPNATRAAADLAVRELGWTKPYFLDADHINLKTYSRYIAPCDFFTIDVADSIGAGADGVDSARFLDRHPELHGTVTIPGIERPIEMDRAFLQRTGTKFLGAVSAAGEIYRAIQGEKGAGNFIAEISMDETDTPQTPAELLVILAAIADAGIPIQTIAPKFTGRFNKGVDYVGDVEQFGREFREDIATIDFAVERYGLPRNLKLSVHSGSDKYSIYPAIHAGLQASGAGVHLKTAGTTWLEELIGLAEAGGDALVLAKDIYAEAYAHADELCAPYATVIDIHRHRLPTPQTVRFWTGEQYVRALRHEGNDQAYNPDLRQLLHIGFKVAARMGRRFTEALEANEAVIARNVTKNLYDRHLRPVFLGG